MEMETIGMNDLLYGFTNDSMSIVGFMLSVSTVKKNVTFVSPTELAKADQIKNF